MALSPHSLDIRHKVHLQGFGHPFHLQFLFTEQRIRAAVGFDIQNLPVALPLMADGVCGSPPCTFAISCNISSLSGNSTAPTSPHNIFGKASIAWSVLKFNSFLVDKRKSPLQPVNQVGRGF